VPTPPNAAPAPEAPPDPRWPAARALVLRHGWNAVAFQILNPGMRLWTAAAGDAVAGHQSYARVRVVAGAPVCTLDRLPGAAAELEADARAHGERVVFFGAGTRLERILGARRDHAVVRLGAQPAWDPAGWAAIVRRKASLRAQLHRARNKGVRVVEWAPERSRGSAVLRAVLDAWLATRGLPPLGFMVTPDLLGHTEDRRVFVAERGGAVVGFLVATPVPARDGWLVEQWPRVPDAPNGTTHLLVDAAMRAFADAGSRYATLGLSPLSPRGAEGEPVRPAWLRVVLRHLRAHGRRFYNFRGLEAFKAGLEPDHWEPVYAIADGPRFTPRLLRGIAGVFSGGSPTRLMARAVASAAAQELRTARASLRAHGGTR
jgi:phosphatidylglycerol lysyltransferase